MTRPFVDAKTEWLYMASEAPITEYKNYSKLHPDTDMRTGLPIPYDTLAKAYLDRAADYGPWYYHEIQQHPRLREADELCKGKVKGAP